LIAVSLFIVTFLYSLSEFNPQLTFLCDAAVIIIIYLFIKLLLLKTVTFNSE